MISPPTSLCEERGTESRKSREERRLFLPLSLVGGAAAHAMGQTQTVFLPPWVPSTENEKQAEAEFREAIIKLSATAANLIAPHP